MVGIMTNHAPTPKPYTHSTAVRLEKVVICGIISVATAVPRVLFGDESREWLKE